MFFIGPILKAKALQLHKMISEARGDEPGKTFVASDGWLWRFSRRHVIRQLALQGEKLSADKPAADHFVTSFRTFVEDNQYTLNQIFNCDETGLYYNQCILIHNVYKNFFLHCGGLKFKLASLVPSRARLTSS